MRLPPFLLLAAALCAAIPAMAAKHAGHARAAVRSAGGALAPDALSPAARLRPVGPGARGGAVLRAQVLLDRAHFSSGEIDAAWGANLREAVAGFQQAKGLKLSGRVDKATWEALKDDAAPILADYTITEADAAGPYEAVPEDMAEKAKMKSLGFASAAEALAERFHASPALLRRLNPGKQFEQPGEQIRVPNVEGAAAVPKAARVLVEGKRHTLTLFDGAGKAIAQFPASSGSEHDPLPVGTWKVDAIARNPVFHYNPKLFWDGKPGDSKAAIPAGPNNPVGVVWIDLSKEHYGIHGTPEPSGIGKTQSHGCIRLTNWDAVAAAQSLAAGVPVVLQQ